MCCTDASFLFRWRKLVGVVVTFAALTAVGCKEAVEPAELILTNGRLITVDDDHPTAQALAARGGVIVAVGTDAEIARYRGDETQVIDLDGRLAIPGFVEGHAHFMGLGEMLMIVDLRDTSSWEEVVRRVAAAADDVPPGRWVLGRGWHQEKWDTPVQPNVEGYPTHDLLSRAVSDHPVSLTHASGHAVMVNRLAMEAAGITADTPDPEGGEILRDAAGRPTGLMRETAEELIQAAVEASDRTLPAEEIDARLERQIELATRECLTNGITSFQDAGSSLETVDRFDRAAREGTLGVRLWVMLNDPDERIRQAADRLPFFDDEHMLTVRAIKRVMDGALGSHGAWLLEPYDDLPGSVGLNTITVEQLERTAQVALDLDLQLCVHAIGDRANREVLDVFEQAYATQTDDADLRWRVEHAQHLNPEDVPRFGELGVIASVQSVHCTSDGPWVSERLGEERAAEGAYLWRALLDSGAVVSNGTDAPVEDIDPIANFYSSVTRRMDDNTVFYPQQRMTREEALRSYTIDAAYAAFEEEIKGSLTPGKLADVTVLSRDIMTVPEEEIPGTEVVYTILGGKVVHRNDGS
jgi:predicted amidohydrolase YtcJ